MKTFTQNTLKILVDNYKKEYEIKENVGDKFDNYGKYYYGEIIPKDEMNDVKIYIYKFGELSVYVNSVTGKVLQFNLELEVSCK